MSKIKLVAWDVYGTIIDSYNDESSDVPNPLKLRPGALEILSEIKSRKIEQITISDGDLGNLKKYLGEAGITNWNDYFFDLYSMTKGRLKDIVNMFDYYKENFGWKFNPETTLVIRDNYGIDIELAKKQGCKTIHVPILKEYGVNSLPVNEIKKFF